MNHPGYGEARFQHPESHWLDLPEATDEEMEEETGSQRKPICTFVKKQTLLVHYGPKELVEYQLLGPRKVSVPHRLIEFPISGDERGSKGDFYEGHIYGYILQRRPEFEDHHYNWMVER